MLDDLRYALRLLLRSPGFTLAAILTLALGLGPAAAVFSLTDALGLRPLEVRSPGDLLVVHTGTAERPEGESSYPDFEAIRDGTDVFADLAAYGSRGVALAGADLPDTAIIQVVSPNFFSLLGVRAAAGRLFTPADEQTAEWPAVAVISDSLWQRRFAGRPDAVGSLLELNGQPFTVTGVATRGFRGLRTMVAADVWIPAEGWPLLQHGDRTDIEWRGRRWFTVIARLGDGVTLDAARADVALTARRLAQTYPDTHRDRTALVVPEPEARGRTASRLRMLLLAGVGLVLAIGCTNVAGLLLVRGETRRRELAVRAALGGSPRRLFVLLLSESVVLAGAATLGGLVLGDWVIVSLPALVPPTPLPLDLDFRLTQRVVGFTVAVALATMGGFGVLPALAASRPSVLPLIKGGLISSAPRRSRSARAALVVGQLALTLTLLVAAGLIGRSLREMQRLDLGFEPGPMVLLTLAPGAAEFGPAQLVTYQHTLTERVAAIPGVTGVSLARRMPLSPFGGGAAALVSVPGHEPPTGERGFSIRHNTVAPGYFRTVGTRIVRGRDFTLRDGRGDPRVVVISQTMARTFWPGGDPIGQRIQIGAHGTDHEIIGIVQDGKYVHVTEATESFLYLSTEQYPLGELTLLVRPSKDERQVATAVRQAVAGIDQRVPALQSLTMADHLRFAMFETRTMTILAVALGLVGLALAVVGVYAVIAYLVSRRSRELGIRLALGASPHRLMRDVLGWGAALVGIALALGLGLSLVAGRALAGTLYGVSPGDPMTLAIACLVLAVAAIGATAVPASRAATIDPAVTLRTD